ncbi:hypothetical protein TspCOW1_19050 [Thiohalobacter sp. COW1]|uniref:CpsD/CapB family tyrosine-protein kinase n=1 Tax=Thiohalobacter sp. COW1 TaxID=2795687 RepID=UPI0019153DC1|nr:CpsD/CapB family tyrosine-protein kinase [Thiohalobacter sp. COW1]BCO31802.1 hypothetical protein TspCOW1_19050 [Thiohalobacter sp. COW1]
MERIKVALEKARKDRESGTQPQAHRPAAPGRAVAKAASTKDISYTQTRTTRASNIAMKKHRILPAYPSGEYADAFKILRTQVLQRLRENNWNVLAVTSPSDGEGKTVTAINLAASIALEIHHTVLLVDANLRQPSIHDYLGIGAAQGLSEYLLDEVDLADLLVHPEGLEHVVLLPGGRPVQNSAELLNSPRMIQLVEELKTRYPERIVVFDLPPVLTAADALAFAPYVDAALLVLEDGKTQQQEAQRAVELLENTNILGTVLNKSEAAG